MAVTLSIIIPTLGRPSLEATLASCADADEIVVVLDTARGATELPCRLPANAVYAEGCFGVTGGHAARQHGIGLATGSHLAFFDDDDVYTPDAIQLMRDAACDVPVIFRIDHDQHGVIWRDPSIWFGNVTTQQYLVPNRPELFGSWTPIEPTWAQPGGDCTFIRETVENFGGIAVWRKEVIAVMRPDEERIAWYRPLPSVAVVTPWRDHLELATDYLDAVEPELRRGDELIIVDTGSNPSLDFATVTVGDEGFCGGCNAGLNHATTDAVLFLNNDIALGRRGWLDKIRRALEPGCLVGPLRHDAHADVDGQRFPYVDGWCLAGMREDLLSLGGFDETLQEPAYYSDNLLCLEARIAGMTLREVRVGLQHKENVTAGRASDTRVRAASEANRARYLARVREVCGIAA